MAPWDPASGQTTAARAAGSRGSHTLPLVTVIIPVRNGEQFIADAVASILSQTLADLEVIVVNDASTDGTLPIVRAIEDPRLRIVVNASRMGVSASRNRGIAEARSAYIAFLDADDVAYPGRLEAQMRFLEANPAVAVVGSHMDYIDASGRLLYRESPGQRPGAPAALRRELLARACILPSTAMARRSVLEAAGGFPKLDYAEDHELWCQIAVQHDLAILPERLVAYRHHGAQATFRKIRTAHEATQACICRAGETFYAAGLIEAGHRPSPPALWTRLRGGPGSLGAAYMEWARLHSWALRQPRQAGSLALASVMRSPLSLEPWTILLRSASQLTLPPTVRHALSWYGSRLRHLLTLGKTPR